MPEICTYTVRQKWREIKDNFLSFERERKDDQSLISKPFGYDLLKTFLQDYKSSIPVKKIWSSENTLKLINLFKEYYPHLCQNDQKKNDEYIEYFTVVLSQYVSINRSLLSKVA